MGPPQYLVDGRETLIDERTAPQLAPLPAGCGLIAGSPAAKSESSAAGSRVASLGTCLRAARCRGGLRTLPKSAPGGADAATPFRRARFLVKLQPKPETKRTRRSEARINPAGCDQRSVAPAVGGGSDRAPPVSGGEPIAAAHSAGSSVQDPPIAHPPRRTWRGSCATPEKGGKNRRVLSPNPGRAGITACRRRRDR
jgi:hypothetical protein